MAYVILNASRDAARSTALRCAAAVCGSGLVVGSAALDHLLPRRSSISFYCSRSDGLPQPVDSSLYHFENMFSPPPGKVEFVALEKDLESDEALWDLYKRWCKAFNQERHPDEMAYRFSRFKETVFLVDRTNKACLPYKLGINKFADGKNIALVCPRVPFNFKSRRKMMGYSNSGTFRGAAGEFKKEP